MTGVRDSHGRFAQSSPPSLDWQAGAACRSADATLFFAPDVELPGDKVWREAQARAICGECPVADRCLDWRLSFESQADAGIWAGRDQDERTAMRHALMKRQQREEEAA